MGSTTYIPGTVSAIALRDHMLSAYTRHITLLMLMIVFISAHTCGQALTLRNTDSIYTLTYPALFRDTGRNMDIAAVYSAPFAPSRQAVVALGVTSDAAWIYFDVVNQTGRDNWCVEVAAPVLHTVDIYIKGPTSTRHMQVAVDDHGFAARPVKVNDLIFPLHLAPDTVSRIYVRVTSNNTLRIPVRIATMERLYETNHRIDFGNGFYFGLMVTLTVYNLFVFLLLKDPTYLYYAGYIFFSAILQLIWNGYLLDFFPGSALNLASLACAISMIFSVLFTNAFLQTARDLPHIYRWQPWLIGLLCIPVLLLMTGIANWSFRVFQWEMFGGFIFWLYTGVMSWRKGYPPAKYYLVAFVTLIVTSLIFNGRDNGRIPDHWFSMLTLQTGPCLEALILSFALAVKLNRYKQEKEKTQAMALAQANNFSRDLITMQEMERKRVASELHDSVGQQLILLKNRTLSLRGHANEQVQRLSHDLGQDIGDVLQEIRDISYSLRPYQMDMLGLTESVKSLAADMMEAAGIDCTIAVDNIDQVLGREREMNLYRIVQEVLNNIVKHAGASLVAISICHEPDQLEIIIRDNGKGFSPDTKVKGLGLTSIRERVALLEGNLDIIPHMPSGTVVKIIIPVKS